MGRWADNSADVEAKRNPTVAQVARIRGSAKSAARSPTTLREVASSAKAALWMSTWSRIPQCCSKSSEMTRAPGWAGVLTATVLPLSDLTGLPVVGRRRAIGGRRFADSGIVEDGVGRVPRT